LRVIAAGITDTYSGEFMKLTYTRASALLVLALGLSACGGKATFDVGGPISGLYFTGLKITNTTNGDVVSVEPPAAAAAGVTSFKLATKLEYGQPYNVKITNLPEHQNCTLFNGADTAGRLATINIGVACTVLTFPIGGTVSGLIERDPLTDTTSTHHVNPSENHQRFGHAGHRKEYSQSSQIRYAYAGCLQPRLWRGHRFPADRPDLLDCQRQWQGSDRGHAG
jgi:hypothetical protein